MYRMNEGEYRMLTEKRETLKSLLGKATLSKHKKMIEQQLNDVRTQISKSHHEQYRTQPSPSLFGHSKTQ